MHTKKFIIFLIAVMFLISGWGKKHERTLKRYQPYENILEVVAEFYRHRDDDLYLYKPAIDISGINIYKATIKRLDNFRKLYPSRLSGMIHYIEAESYERLRLYEKALYHFYKARHLIEERAVLDKINQSIRMLRVFKRIKDAQVIGMHPLQDSLDEYEYKIKQWRRLYGRCPEGIYKVFALIELEAEEVKICDFVAVHIDDIDDGFKNVIQMYQELIVRHIHSKRVNEHMLRFGSFYEAMARMYVNTHDPDSFTFDEQELRSFIDPATKLYQTVASKDGYIEKIEAEGRLKSLLAYVQKIKGEN